jgi:hypothetical protein
MRNTPSYSPLRSSGQDFRKDYVESDKTIKLEPSVKLALIDVAGTWAVEMNKSKPELTANDLANSFRDAYSALALIFLMPGT